MKKILTAFLILILIYGNVAFAANIPAGTPITVVPDKEIDCDDVKLEQMVYFTTVEPVKVDGHAVIKSGARVTGQVVKRKNNGLIGLPGEVQVGNLKLKTPNGEQVNIKGVISDKGDGRYWANVGWLFLFPLLFIKGDDGKIQSGQPKVIYTLEDYSANSSKI